MDNNTQHSQVLGYLVHAHVNQLCVTTHADLPTAHSCCPWSTDPGEWLLGDTRPAVLDLVSAARAEEHYLSDSLLGNKRVLLLIIVQTGITYFALRNLVGGMF